VATWSCDGGNTGGGLYSGGAPGNVGNGGGTGTVAARCAPCGTAKCPTEAKACTDLPVCRQLFECTVNCAATDAACKNGCTTAAASNNAAVVAGANYLACLALQCTTECFSASGSGGAGGTGTSAGGTSSATGGAATGGRPTLHRCEGTNTVSACSMCGGTNPSCNCNSIPGCSGTTTFTCSGTPTIDCTQFDQFTECASAGCAIDYSETSANICMTPTCASLSGNANCASLPGCSVSNPLVACSGTPTLCTYLTSASCSTAPGCKWVEVP
jgi:hypothetical protein